MRTRLLTLLAALITLVGCLTLASAGPAAASTAKRPTVTKLSRPGGPLNGGLRLYIWGTGFAQVKTVTFGSTRARVLKVYSTKKMLVATPKHAAGPVPVRVTTAKGTSHLTVRDRFTFLPAPVLTSVSASAGSVNGSTITLTGRNFIDVTAVKFGAGAAQRFTVLSSKQIRVATGAHPESFTDIRVVTDGGVSAVSAHDRFAFMPPPRIWSVTQAQGGLSGGDRVQLMGNAFIGVKAVDFGGVAGTELKVTSQSTLLVTAPKRSALGTVDVRVVGAYGTSTVTVGDHYAYVGLPTSVATSQLAPGPVSTDGSAGNVWVDAGCTNQDCYGVGVYDTSTSDEAIIETRTNDQWSWAPAPLPADASTLQRLSELDAISCFADGCVAVGSYLVGTTSDSLHVAPLVETMSDGIWTASSGASAGVATDVEFTDVSCTAVDFCAAMGQDDDGAILSTMKSDGRWYAQQIASPVSTAQNYALLGLACGSPWLCVAVGDYLQGTASGAFVESYEGDSWTSHLITNPLGAGANSRLLGAACADGSTCVAVGSADTAAGTGLSPLVVTEVAGKWSASLAPRPAGISADAVGELNAISCAGGSCVAAGDVQSGADSVGLIERFAFGEWRASSSAAPEGTSRAFLVVSCSDAARCVLGGLQQPTGGDGTAAAGVAVVTGPGGTVEPALPMLDGTTGAASLLALGCGPANLCAAVGEIKGTPQDVLVTVTD